MSEGILTAFYMSYFFLLENLWNLLFSCCVLKSYDMCFSMHLCAYCRTFHPGGPGLEEFLEVFLNYLLNNFLLPFTQFPFLEFLLECTCSLISYYVLTYFSLGFKIFCSESFSVFSLILPFPSLSLAISEANTSMSFLVYIRPFQFVFCL